MDEDVSVLAGIDEEVTVNPAGRRACARSRTVFMVLGLFGLLFAATVVSRKQRDWELNHGGVLLVEEYARDLGDGDSMHELAALRKQMERTSHELQGSDREQSRAIRREEEELAPRPSAGVEQGASAEWASRGARAEWMVGDAAALRHQQQLSSATQELDAHQLRSRQYTSLPPIALGVGSQAATPRIPLSQAVQSLAQKIRQEEQEVRLLGKRITSSQAAAGAPVLHAGDPVFHAAPVASKSAFPSTAKLQEDYERWAAAGKDAGVTLTANTVPGYVPTAASQELSQISQGDAAGNSAAALYKARAQQLSQISTGGGAVYAPSVMTPYQQTMLQQYMGAPTIAVPPAVEQQHATAFAHQPLLEPQRAAAQTKFDGELAAMHDAKRKVVKSTLAGVGKAVEEVALDSDGVLQHAESIMSTVKKLLVRPATAAAAGVAVGARKTALEQRHETPEEKALEQKIAAQKAANRRLAEKLAGIRVSGKRGTDAVMRAGSTARTQLLEGVSASADEKTRKIVSNAWTALNASTVLMSNHSVPVSKAAPAFHDKDGKAEPVASSAGDSKLLLPPKAPTAVEEPGEEKQREERERKVLVHSFALARSQQMSRKDAATPQSNKQHKPAGPVAAAAAAAAEKVAPVVRGTRTHGQDGASHALWGGHTPLINVDIRDSKIEGGMNMNGNTGERKGLGAQSGCGPLCELGKIVKHVEASSDQVLSRQPRVPSSLATASVGKPMVERDYVISHIEGRPVYARELVPASAPEEEAAGPSSGDAPADESTLEKAIEREGEREGERREWRRERRKRRELERDGDAMLQRKRSGERDGGERGGGQSLESNGSVLPKGDEAKGEGRGSKGEEVEEDAVPKRYKAVRYMMPLDEYAALSGLKPKHVTVNQDALIGHTALDGLPRATLDEDEMHAGDGGAEDVRWEGDAVLGV